MTATLAQGLSPVRAELANGAVIIAQENAMTPAVTISAAFRAGSMFDPEGLEGLAYVSGRTLDRGTEQRSASRIAEELDDLGVTLKVSTNRHTMTLSATCLVQDFDTVLSIVADVSRCPVFPDAEIAKRRVEALTTLRQIEDNPAARATDAVLELLYGWNHPYGRPPKGTIAGVERVTRADMTAFRARRLRPSVLSLVIVGDVLTSHALERATAEFEDWRAEPAGRYDVPAPSATGGRRERIIAMPGKPQTEVVYGLMTIRRLDPRYYAYWMMNNILGQFGLGGRLAENIRERQGMAYYAFSNLEPAAVEGPLLIRAGVDPANLGRALAAIDHEVETLAAEGPSEREVDETRAYLIGSIPRMLETNQSIASFLQSAEEYGLGLDFDQRLPGYLQAVTAGEVRAAAAETLDPDRAAIAVAGPPDDGVRAPGQTRE